MVKVYSILKIKVNVFPLAQSRVHSLRDKTRFPKVSYSKSHFNIELTFGEKVLNFNNFIVKAIQNYRTIL